MPQHLSLHQWLSWQTLRLLLLFLQLKMVHTSWKKSTLKLKRWHWCKWNLKEELCHNRIQQLVWFYASSAFRYLELLALAIPADMWATLKLWFLELMKLFFTLFSQGIKQQGQEHGYEWTSDTYKDLVTFLKSRSPHFAENTNNQVEWNISN